MTFILEKYHPTGFNHMSVVLVHKVGFFVYIHTSGAPFNRKHR